MSLALGATWKPRQTGVHFTIEWFDAVSSRRALEPEPFLDQTTGETVTPEITYAADQVINFGIGLEHDFESKLSLYAAFRSDYSSNPQDGSDSLSLASWNLWHVSTGAAFRFLNLEFNTGVQYSWGSHDESRFVNFNPDEGETVITEPGTFTMKYRRLKVLVGFNLPVLNTP
jgi:long-subunit fatty acid transport protein